MDPGILTELDTEAVTALAGWVGGGSPGLASASAGWGLSARPCSIAGGQEPHSAVQQEDTSVVLFTKQKVNPEFRVSCTLSGPSGTVFSGAQTSKTLCLECACNSALYHPGLAEAAQNELCA